MIKIDGVIYEIEQAYMDALLDDEEEEKLFFGLEIDGKKVDDKTLPLITSDTLLKINKYEIKNWQDISGRVIEWEKYTKNIWKPHLKFVNCYKNTFRGNFMYNTRIEFKNIDKKIFVKIKGLCDSKFNGKDIKTLTLEIETEVAFEWINTGPHESEEAARNKLNPYLDSKYYEYSISELELSDKSKTKMGHFDLKIM